MFSEEIAVTLLSLVLTGIGTVVWKWVNSIESKLNSIQKVINDYTPTISNHIERLDTIETKVDQLIHREIETTEKVMHLIQLLNKECYKINALSNSLEECKKANAGKKIVPCVEHQEG